MSFAAVEKVFAGTALGHGRMTECALATVCLLYGLILAAAPDAVYRSIDVADLAWTGPGRLIAIPFLLKALLTGSGVWANICGQEGSRTLRFLGALVGVLIWVWIAANLAMTQEFCALGFSVSIVNAGLSVRIMALSLANLPRPGAPGRLG